MIMIFYYGACNASGFFTFRRSVDILAGESYRTIVKQFEVSAMERNRKTKNKNKRTAEIRKQTCA